MKPADEREPGPPLTPEAGQQQPLRWWPVLVVILGLALSAAWAGVVLRAAYILLLSVFGG
jgi:hypothetical protein